MSTPLTMLVQYHPKAGKEGELLELVKKHWPELNRLGLVSSQPPHLWRAVDKRSGQVHFVEIFQWKDRNTPDAAHRSPEVMAIWGPMEQVLEKLELSQLEPIGD
jgi:hypothetical protein